MDTSSLTSKGQVTIPSALREQFLLRPGDKVRFEVIDGNIVIKPLKKSVDSLAGCFAEDIGDQVASLEQMEQAIEVGRQSVCSGFSKEQSDDKHGRD